MDNEKNFKDFIILWLTQSLSRLGSSLTPFALILWAYGETGSAMSTALLTVSSYAPYILLSLPVGTFTDKKDKKCLIVSADAAASICTLAVLVLLITGQLQLYHLYAANFLIGIAQSFQMPASEVAVTMVTPKDMYQKAASLSSLSHSVISMASPVIAATLYSLGGLTLVILVDLGTFFIATTFLVLCVRIPGNICRREEEERSISRDLKEAVSFLVDNLGLLEVILFLSAINFIASIYNTALPAMILSLEDEAALASVQATAGIAMLIGSIASTLLPRPKSRIKAILLSLFVAMSTEIFLLSFFRSPFVWCLGAFLGWICIPIMNTNLDALMRTNIPEDLQGRVYAARNMLQFFTIPLGYLVGGLLVDSVFEPLMARQDTRWLKVLFGYGKGSGAAFLFAVLGFSGVLTCLIFSRFKAMRALEEN